MRKPAGDDDGEIVHTYAAAWETICSSKEKFP